MRAPDWISLVEAAYDYAAEDAWLAGVLRAATPLFPADAQLAAFSAELTPTRFRIADVAVPQDAPELADAVRATNAHAPRVVIDACYRSGDAVGSLSERVFARHPEARERFREGVGGRFEDVLGVVGHTGDGHLVMLSAALNRTARPSALQRRRWPRVAAHVAAGLRVRRWVRRRVLDEGAVAAVLDPSGRVLDARVDARSASARECLRQAVRRIDVARSARGRAESDGALAAWEALVAGRWSLVDRFDADGRRWIVAVQADPMHPDPRGLSKRERQVATFVGLGHATKRIAYALGLSTTSVTTHASRAAAKLGLRSRAELAAFFSPRGVRARLAEVAIDGDRFLVGASAMLDGEQLARLTPSEREIAALLIVGDSDADIARRRAVSARTVAKQAQEIYRKLGVGSRVELAAALTR